MFNLYLSFPSKKLSFCSMTNGCQY
jgi:hypothetical protein